MHSVECIAQRDENRVQPNRCRGTASRRSALSTASRSALRNTKLQTLSRLTFVVREQARSKESGPWTLRVRPPELGPTLSLARDHDPSASCCHADCFVVPPQTIITPSSLECPWSRASLPTGWAGLRPPRGARLCRPFAFPTLVPPVGSLRKGSAACAPSVAPPLILAVRSGQARSSSCRRYRGLPQPEYRSWPHPLYRALPNPH